MQSRAGHGLEPWLGPLLAVLAMILITPAPLLAAESGQIRLGDDYAQFHVGGADWHPCEHECNGDAKCKSWTYITAVGQCRLKHGVPPAAANGCCVSGVKDDSSTNATNDERECGRLTEEALDANDENLSSRCGLSGPLWSGVYSDIYARCVDGSPRRRGRDAEERKQALQACKQGSERGGQLACDHYARMSLAQNATNQTNNCGLPGSDWAGTYDAYVNWCRSAKRAAVSDQIAGRERQLLECLGRSGGESDPACESYAALSVSQFTKSRQIRCGDAFSGPGWHNDHAEHYRWCRAHSETEREQMVGSRKDALAQCADDGNHFRLIFKF